MMLLFVTDASDVIYYIKHFFKGNKNSCARAKVAAFHPVVFPPSPVSGLS